MMTPARTKSVKSAKIYILPEGNSWRVKCGHCRGESVKDKYEEAAEMARDHISWYPKGTVNEILVERGGGWQLEWELVRDDFPERPDREVEFE